MYAKPTSPQSIGQVLDGSFRLAAASFKHTWIYALLAAIASYAATIYQFTTVGATVGAAPTTVMATGDAIFWTLYCVGILGSLFFMSAMYVRTDQIASGESDGASPIGTALGRLPLLVVMSILTILVLIVGYLLLVIPGLILTVSLILSTLILVLEQKGPIASLNSSHKLVWGYWWRTFAILLVAGIIALVMWFVVAFIAGAIAPLLAGESSAMEVVLSATIGIALIGVILAPFFISLLLNIYWDLKLRREGGDLAARVQG